MKALFALACEIQPSVIIIGKCSLIKVILITCGHLVLVGDLNLTLLIFHYLKFSPL